MPDIETTLTAGVEARGYRRGAAATDGWDQYVIPVEDRIVSFAGRTAAFRTPGRAGTAGQAVAAIFNAADSSVLVDVTGIAIDLAVTVAKAVTVLPPIIRIARITALPTGGTAGPKVAESTAALSNASVTTHMNASADGTSSATPLAATPAANTTLTQEYAPRMITGAGYEMADRIELLAFGAPTLAAGQGLVVWLAYSLATQNPVTDMWLPTIRWQEYTRP